MLLGKQLDLLDSFWSALLEGDFMQTFVLIDGVFTGDCILRTGLLVHHLRKVSSSNCAWQLVLSESDLKAGSTARNANICKLSKGTGLTFALSLPYRASQEEAAGAAT